MAKVPNPIQLPDWLKLDIGGHQLDEEGHCELCVVEVLAVMVGVGVTDQFDGVHPIIRGALNTANDAEDDTAVRTREMMTLGLRARHTASDDEELARRLAARACTHAADQMPEGDKRVTEALRAAAACLLDPSDETRAEAAEAAEAAQAAQAAWAAEAAWAAAAAEAAAHAAHTTANAAHAAWAAHAARAAVAGHAAAHDAEDAEDAEDATRAAQAAWAAEAAEDAEDATRTARAAQSAWAAEAAEDAEAAWAAQSAQAAQAAQAAVAGHGAANAARAAFYRSLTAALLDEYAAATGRTEYDPFTADEWERVRVVMGR
jgi:hypothetical protein